MRVGIFLYPQAEVLDFSGPFEVFSTANRVAPKPMFEVALIAQANSVVNARGGFLVTSHYGITEHPAFDLLLVAGGDHRNELGNQPVLNWLAQQYAVVRYKSSVCTGVFLWAAAGVIDNKAVTTHHDDIADLKHRFPTLQVQEDKRWVEDGDFISSAGISAGIDMSLQWLVKLASYDLALATARQMEYQWSQ